MKKMLCLLPLCLLALGGCSQARVDTTPVWQQELPASGAEMTLSNCTLLSDDPVYYALERSDPDQWMESPALQTEGIPVVTLRNVAPDQVELRFVEKIDTLYLYYDKRMPQPKLDYIVTELADGSLQYRLDTVYSYQFVVTTEKGTDRMIVTCQREGLD